MADVTRAPRAPTAGSASAPTPDWVKDFEPIEKATSDQLTNIRQKAGELRDKTIEKIQIEENLSSVNKDIERIQRQELPGLMLGAKVDFIGLEASGNLPAMDFPLEDDIYANIPADWEPELREKGFDTVIELGGEDNIKNVLTIRGGRKTNALMQRIVKGVQKLLLQNPEADITWDIKPTVQWNTLSAWFRELVHRGKEPTAEQKTAIGARVGKIVKPKVRKPEDKISKTNRRR